MQRRFTFDNYLGMALFAVLCTCVLFATAILLGPQIHACFCPMRLVGESSPGWGCCGQLPVPGVIQAFPILCAALLGISLLVAALGIVLGQTRRTTIDLCLVYALELCPVLTLVFLGVVGCIVYSFAFVFLQ
jgi:hypothetical protein